VDFLRKGYPQGVPEQDYVPLFALLRRKPSDEEVTALADELAENSPDEQTSAAIRSAIAKVIASTPAESDVDRVFEQLVAAG
jgi:hypothetical protein